MKNFKYFALFGITSSILFFAASSWGEEVKGGGITYNEQPQAAPSAPVASAPLIIVGVVIDSPDQVIHVYGERFDNGTDVSVMLGDYVILPEDMISATGEEIIFSAPENLPDGDYLLTISTGSSVNQIDHYHLTIFNYAADAALQEAIDVEAAAREAADSDLAADLAAEAAARKAATDAADAALKAAIDAEAAARQAADNAETAARESADNAEAATRQAADNSEAAARQAADNAEAATRSSADAALQDAINAEANARQAGDSGLGSDLAAEAAARQAGDSGLGSDLAAEAATRQAADTTLATADATHSARQDNPHVVKLAQVMAPADGGELLLPFHVWADIPGPMGYLSAGGAAYTVDPFLPDHHVAIIENTRRASTPCPSCEFDKLNTGGLAVILHTQDTDPANPLQHPYESINTNDHYVSFYTKDQRDTAKLAGRIEGVTLTDIKNVWDKLAASGDTFFTGLDGFVQPDIQFHPVTDWLKINVAWPSLTGGSLPTLEGGKLWSIDTSPGGTDRCGDGDPTPDFELCIVGVFDWNIYVGEFPRLNKGYFPTLNPGSLNFNGSTGPLKKFAIAFDPTVAAGAWGASKTNFGSGAALALEARFNPAGFALRYAKAASGVGVTYESGSGDYAEWLERLDPEETIVMAQVVGVHGGKISKQTRGADNVMVVSYKPIVLGNMPEPGKEENYEKVAFMGQTLVMVRGAVHKGDFIIPSGYEDGTAIAIPSSGLSANELGRVIGVAWEDAVNDSPVNLVNVAMGLRPVEISHVVKKQEAAVENLSQELENSKKLIASLADENAAIRQEALQLKASMEAIQYQLEDIDTLKAAMVQLALTLERIETSAVSDSNTYELRTAQ